MSGMNSFRDLADFFTQYGATGKYNNVDQGDVEVAGRQIQLQTYRNLIYQQLKLQSAGSEEVIGAPAVEERIKAALKPIDGYIELAGGKDGNTPLAQAHMIMNKAIAEDVLNRALVNRDTKEATRLNLLG